MPHLWTRQNEIVIKEAKNLINVRKRKQPKINRVL